MDGHAAVLARARRSSRCSRCTAAPGGRRGTRLRGRGRPRRTRASRSPRRSRTPRTRASDSSGSKTGGERLRPRRRTCRRGRAERGPVRRGDQRERLGVVLDLAADRHEDRLVRLIELTMFSPGMSAAVTTTTFDQSKAGIEVEGHEAGVRVGRADGAPVPGAREDEVVGVLRGAGELPGPLAPERGDGSGASGHDRAGLDDEGVRAARSGSSCGGCPPLAAEDTSPMPPGAGGWGAHTQVRPEPHRTSLAVAMPHQQVGTTRYWFGLIRGLVPLSSVALGPVFVRSHPDHGSAGNPSSSPHRRRRREYRPHHHGADPSPPAVAARPRPVRPRSRRPPTATRPAGIGAGSAAHDRTGRPGPGRTPMP